MAGIIRRVLARVLPENGTDFVRFGGPDKKWPSSALVSPTDLEHSAAAMSASNERILVTVTGSDCPGITVELSSIISRSGAHLHDIEQVVIQGQLTLCLVVDVDRAQGHGAPVIKDLLFAAKERGLDLNFDLLPDLAKPNPTPQSRYAVTVIGNRLDAATIHALTEVLAGFDANIETIKRLSDATLRSLEISVAMPKMGARIAALHQNLLKVASEQGVDLAFQRERLTRRSKRLLVMDMDSTLIQIEVIDELARCHGVYDQVAGITERAMLGSLPYEESLLQRVALLKGMPIDSVMQVAGNPPVTEGAPELLAALKTLGLITAVISGGFSFAAEALKKRFDLDYAYSNQLEVREGLLTGQVVGPLVGPQRKADLLDAIAQREGISLEQTVAVGDGANDLPMLKKAGLGIAFRAKPTLRAAADTSLTQGGLDRILYLLGLRERDVKELMGG